VNTAEPTSSHRKKKNRSVFVSVLLLSVGFHLLAGLVAAVYVVSKWLAPPEATFVAKKMVSIPPQILDPKMAAAELEAAAPRPALDEKMASLRETNFALPDIPQMPVDQVMDFDPSAVISDSALGLGVGAGGGDGAGASGGEGESALSFFGIQTQAKSVVIVFDVSLSVLNKAQKSGLPITKIQEETIRLIDALSINTRFNLVQFSRYYQPMAAEMQSPNEASKTMAKNWLEKEFRREGSLPRSARGVKTPVAGQDNGICFVLEGVLSFKPDVVFLISDGSFQSEFNQSQVPWSEVEDVIKNYEKSGGSSKIHFIGFEMKPEDKKELRSLVRKTGGTIKELGKEDGS
jgi:hypothetical protein